MKYDYLIIGAGLAGALYAYFARKAGNSVLVIEKRPHVGGNMYCENIEGINVHRYGPHIFHTKSKAIWDFMNSLVPFNNFRYCPLACNDGRLYHLPFNMNTFYELWGTRTPAEAIRVVNEQGAEVQGEPSNLEEQAIKLVGRDIYELLIKGYTEKQWGRDCKLLPPFIIKRLHVRFRFDNNYFDDCYQGIPIGGYNKIFDKLLVGVDVNTGTDFFDNREHWESMVEHVVYTGPIDVFFNYKYGALEYRSLSFEEEVLDIENYQGNAAVNYTGHDKPYTRIIEHKHFEFGTQPKTVITREYSHEWRQGKEPYYPINNERNQRLLELYQAEEKKLINTTFIGRLAEYRYYNMDQIVEKFVTGQIK